VNNQVHAQCDSGRPTAFDTPEMLCSHSGSHLGWDDDLAKAF
jgi:hypothetical protein